MKGGMYTLEEEAVTDRRRGNDEGGCDWKGEGDVEGRAGSTLDEEDEGNEVGAWWDARLLRDEVEGRCDSD